MGSFDWLLKGGWVVDGSGAPRELADVGIRDGRIVAVQPGLQGAAHHTLDVTGKVVAPGFIDVHTHDDRAIFSADTMRPKISQGVTTVVTGNCGISLAPLERPDAVPPLDLILEPGGARFATFAAFLDAARESQPLVNMVPLVGHTTLRANTMADLSQPATAQERAHMRDMLEEALQAGAWGLSTGTFYPPAAAAPTDEITDVGRPLAQYGGVYATHMRNEADKVMESLDETFFIGRELGVRVVISHHKLAGLKWHGLSVQTLARIQQAMEQQQVSLDCYPYNASSTVLHPNLIDRASHVLVAWSTPFPQYSGKLLSEVAAELGCTEHEAADRLRPAGAIYFIMSEDDVRRILAFPPTMIGSDGLPHDAHPHPRLWGAFPRVLGHYSRDEGLFPLEEAVRKMTGLPAGEFGIADRGLLRAGYAADIVVFNPDTVIDSATFEHPATPAEGIEHVFVNGQPAWNGNRIHGRHGQVLRKSPPRRCQSQL